MTDTPPLRLAELVIALSLATDIGVGVPMEMMLSICLVSVRLAEALKLGESERREAYYLALLRHAGCTADSMRAAELMGNELDTYGAWVGIDPSDQLQALSVLWRGVVDQRQAMPSRLRLMLRSMLELPAVATARCEVAQQLAERLQMGPQVAAGLLQFNERWDGGGFPRKLKGEAIMRPVRIAQVAHDAVVIRHFLGADAAAAAIRERAGITLDPVAAETLLAQADTLLEQPSALRGEILASEPEPYRTLDSAQVDEATRALADFADLQTPFTAGHSTAVADLAEAAGRHCRLAAADLVLLRRAGHLHDIGRVGISAGIWAKTGPLSEDEWEQVRLHPYYTRRILAHAPLLAELGAIASAHRERLDGSGYHRNCTAAQLSPTMRLLAAAEAYQSMREARPYRPALAAERAAAELRQEVRAGRLDGDAVNAVLAAAGHPPRNARPQRVADLTDREIEVLRLVARGRTNPQVATALAISRKTVGHHLESIYGKLGVTTRAAASYVAMRHFIV